MNRQYYNEVDTELTYNTEELLDGLYNTAEPIDPRTHENQEENPTLTEIAKRLLE